MESLFRFINLAALPVMAMNFLGGIIGFIWLAILGKWSLIGVGFLLMFAGVFIISIALLPGIIFSGPAAFFVSRNKMAPFYFFGFVATAYTMLVLTVWCFFVLIFLAKNLEWMP